MTPSNHSAPDRLITRVPATAARNGPVTRRSLPAGAERLLLWLWKVLPLPSCVRRAYLGLTHPRFLIGVMALIRDER